MITIAEADRVERGHAIPLGQRLLNRPDLVGRIAGLAPPLANWVLGNRLFRRAAEALTGIDAHAALPKVRGGVFRDWLRREDQPSGPTIVYFSGCAVEHFDPGVGIAVVRLLNCLGYRVEAPTSACCALPMLSSGEWRPARRRAKKVVDDLLGALAPESVVVASSTSCGLALRSKYAGFLSFTDAGANRLADSLVDICGFLRDRAIESLAPRLKPLRRRGLYHGPCQLRGHQIGTPALELLGCVEGLEIDISRASCCGIGGTYGYEKGKRPISRSVAGTLLRQIEESGPEFIVCDSEDLPLAHADLSGLPCFHPIEILMASWMAAIRSPRLEAVPVDPPRLNGGDGTPLTTA
jgi:glycerol-3-phosphate dehydrogenase subunit C